MGRVDDVIHGAVAQLGERGLCKPEVVGSIPISSTKIFRDGPLFWDHRAKSPGRIDL